MRSERPEGSRRTDSLENKVSLSECVITRGEDGWVEKGSVGRLSEKYVVVLSHSQHTSDFPAITRPKDSFSL